MTTDQSKDIKDYLHLYLGCEAVATGKKPGTKRYRLSTIATDGGYMFETIPEQFSIALGKDWKIILRPLSDMTEEECMVLCGYDKFKDVRELLKFEKEDKGAFIEYRWKDSQIGLDDGYAYSSSGVYYDKHEWTPELTRYLLSKHFDLFGLIESGLAIDKTKI